MRCFAGRRALIAAWTAAAFFVAGTASAQSGGDVAAARVLFNDARKAVSLGKYDQACPKFEESLRTDFGIGTQFNLADCWEHVGRTASAWAAFLDAAASAKSSGQLDRERVARSRAAALEPKLSRMLIEISAPAAGFELKRNAQPVGQALWGTAVPVDPGVHGVVASAPGKKSWSTKVSIAAGATVNVTIPSLDDAPVSVVQEPATAVAPAPLPQQAAPHADEPTKSHGTQRGVGLVVAAVGVAGIATGTAFLLAYNSKNDEAKGVCAANPSNCPMPDILRRDALRDEASSRRTFAFIGYGAGGVALLGGALLYFLAPSDGTGVGLYASPLIAKDAVGASFLGSF